MTLKQKMWRRASWRYRVALVTVLCCIGLGWIGIPLVTTFEQAGNVHRTVTAVRRLHGKAYLDYECDENGTPLLESDMPWIAKAHRRFAHNYLARIAFVDLPEPWDIRSPMLDSYSLKDNDVLTLAPTLRDLRALALDGRALTDSSLACLNYMPHLRSLSLRCDGIGNAGLVHLHPLSELTFLDLASTQITDGGLAYLRSLTRLKLLRLPETVTEAGISDLQMALPTCIITRG